VRQKLGKHQLKIGRLGIERKAVAAYLDGLVIPDATVERLASSLWPQRDRCFRRWGDDEADGP
jgi:hypothetical protein